MNFMSEQYPDRLNGARARLRAAESHLSSATEQLLQQRRRALYGNPNPAALATAINAFQQADADAQAARAHSERLGGTVSAVPMLEAVAKFLNHPTAPAPAEPAAPERDPEPHVPQEQERRRWEFARWLTQRGKLSEYP